MNYQLSRLFYRFFIALVFLRLLLGTPFSVSAQSEYRAFVAWNPTGTLLAVTNGTKLEIMDAESRKVLNTFTDLPEQVTAAAWSPDGSRIAIPYGTDVQVWEQPWDADSAQLVATLAYGEGYVWSVAWNPTDAHEIAVANGGIVDTWLVDAAGAQIIDSVERRIVHEIAWRPDATQLASTGTGARVEVWNPATGELLSTMFIATWNDAPPSEDKAAGFSLAWSPDGTQIVFGATDGTVRVWDRTVWDRAEVWSLTDEPTSFKGHEDVVWSVDWSPNGEFIASGGEDGTVSIWNPASGEQLELIRVGKPVRSVAWSPDGDKLAFIGSGADSEVEIIVAPLPYNTENTQTK